MATLCLVVPGTLISPDGKNTMLINGAIVIAALIILALAIWWDLTDIRRETDRSQIAFWLHCSAGFFLTRGAFGLVAGKLILDDGFTSGLALQSLVPFLIVLVLGVIFSLVLDRRSMIFGSILPAVGFVANLQNEMLGVLLVGLMLLLLTYAWNPSRRSLLRLLPVAIVAQLPRMDIVQHGQRPTRQHRELQRRILR